MWNHGPKMWEAMRREGMTFTEFEEGEMADVIAYLYGLGLEDAPGNVQNGREIVERRCISCHTLQGKGAGLSPDLADLCPMDSPAEMVSAMWNHAPDMREQQQVKKLKWPKINSEDMADLYAFLQTLSPPVESEH
jgi:mono/diheme cytochrome c family protein